MNTHLYNRALPYFYNLFFKLAAGFFNHFLNTGWVNTTIRNQSLQTESCNLPAKGVERRKNYGFRGIVYYQINPSSCFYCSYVSTLPTNDLTLNFIRFQIEYGNRIFNGYFGSRALNRLNYNLTGLFIGLHAGIFNNFLLQG